MIRLRPIYPVFLFALYFPSLLLADGTASDDITVSKAFSPPSIPGMSMGVIYFTLSNQGGREHLLQKVNTSVAKTAEIHGHVQDGGMMRMRQMAHIHIKPADSTELKSGGLHIMLIGLKNSLVEGQSYPVELVFKDGSKQSIQVPVKSRTSMN